MEAKWKILKVVPPKELDVVERGLSAIRDTFTLVTPGASALFDAYLLYCEGHSDFIANLLYSVSFREGLLFLTIDESFIRFLKSRGKPTSHVIKPHDLVKLFERKR